MNNRQMIADIDHFPYHQCRNDCPGSESVKPVKNKKDNTKEMEISELSNITLTVPNRFWQTFESAFTIPSPGTSNTFGATSILIPKARITQPMKRDRSCAAPSSGTNPCKIFILTSINQLNTILTPICKICLFQILSPKVQSAPQ